MVWKVGCYGGMIWWCSRWTTVEEVGGIGGSGKRVDEIMPGDDELGSCFDVF